MPKIYEHITDMSDWKDNPIPKMTHEERLRRNKILDDLRHIFPKSKIFTDIPESYEFTPEELAEQEKQAKTKKK